MSEFRIFETDEILKRLGKLPPAEAAFLRKKLDNYIYPQLRAMPAWGSNIKKLQGYSPDAWRYRIGRFRLIYTVSQDEGISPLTTGKMFTGSVFFSAGEFKFQVQPLSSLPKIALLVF